MLFVAAVGAMIVAMYFGMSRSFGRVPAPWNIPVDALLLIQFPLLHSLLLTGRGSVALQRLSPKSLGAAMSTTSYALVASVQVLVLFALWTPAGSVLWRADGAVLIVVTGLYAAAWLLLAKALWDAGLALQTGFLGWWAIFRDRTPVFPPLPTAGLFRLVRQPIYVAFALTLWTVPTWTSDQLAVSSILTIYCLGGSVLKERRFRRRFGRAFRSYAAQVPFWSPWPRPSAHRNDLSIYDRAADWWGGETRWLRTLQNMVPARFAFFDPIVGDWRGKSILDLGCGGGFMSVALAKRGANVSGVDPSDAAIAAAVQHATSDGLEIDFRVGTGLGLPYDDASFDIVVCVDVFEHVDELARMLREIRRVLHPDGLLLFDTINGTALASFVMVTLGETVLRLLPRGAHDPAMFVPPERLTRDLESLGFDVGPMVGMGPRGLDRRLDFTFGFLPTLAIQYLGQATARQTLV